LILLTVASSEFEATMSNVPEAAVSSPAESSSVFITDAAPVPASLLEVVPSWLRLGFVSFGGPAGLAYALLV
jgi:chromate transporter